MSNKSLIISFLLLILFKIYMKIYRKHFVWNTEYFTLKKQLNKAIKAFKINLLKVLLISIQTNT